VIAVVVPGSEVPTEPLTIKIGPANALALVAPRMAVSHIFFVKFIAILLQTEIAGWMRLRRTSNQGQLLAATVARCKLQDPCRRAIKLNISIR
jgi:hypothetical protein